LAQGSQARESFFRRFQGLHTMAHTAPFRVSLLPFCVSMLFPHQMVLTTANRARALPHRSERAAPVAKALWQQTAQAAKGCKTLYIKSGTGGDDFAVHRKEVTNMESSATDRCSVDSVLKITRVTDISKLPEHIGVALAQHTFNETLGVERMPKRSQARGRDSIPARAFIEQVEGVWKGRVDDMSKVPAHIGVALAQHTFNETLGVERLPERSQTRGRDSIPAGAFIEKADTEVNGCEAVLVKTHTPYTEKDKPDNVKFAHARFLVKRRSEGNDCLVEEVFMLELWGKDVDTLDHGSHKCVHTLNEYHYLHAYDNIRGACEGKTVYVVDDLDAGQKNYWKLGTIKRIFTSPKSEINFGLI